MEVNIPGGEELHFEENNILQDDPDDTSSNEDEANFDHGIFPEEDDKTLRTAGRFLLTLKYICGVNQTNMKIAIEETEKLIGFVYDETVKKFTDLGCVLPVSVRSPVVKKQVCDVFEQLRTHHRQKTYFEKAYKVIEPKCVTISAKFKKIGEGKKRKVTVVEDNYYYVPVVKTLERLVQHPDFEKMTKREYDPDPNVLDGYMKGEFAKKNPVIKEHPDALRPVFYWDDFEACMARSAHASGKQKLGGLYVTLDNFDPKYRGNLDTIALVALVRSPYVKEHGINAVLKRPVEDLKKLEEGVMMNNKKVFGTLIALEGDNLASHECGGYKCGFTAHKPCRTCCCTLEEVRSGVEVTVSMLRTSSQYNEQITEIENARTQKIAEEKSKEYGLVHRSELNKLSSYHVQNGLPQDLMHLFHEGCLKRGVQNIIRHCVLDLKIVTLEWLNAALDGFDYGYSEMSQKPSPIRDDHLKEDAKLHQSSSQTWVLATILPLILGPLVDPEDSKWEHSIQLLEICRMVFSREINKNMLPYLQSLILSYQKGYIKHYQYLKPKEHFLSHLPFHWEMFGSLVDFQCIRMEANHKILKKFVYTLGNYINIPKSLTKYYQARQAIRLKEPLIRPVSYGLLKRLKLSEQPYSHMFQGVQEVVECNWVNVEGLVIKVERCYFTVGCDKEKIPLFAKVENIIVWPELLFVCKEVQTVMYDVHLSSYKIQEKEILRVYRRSDIIVSRVYHCHCVEPSKYIALKECVRGSF